MCSTKITRKCLSSATFTATSRFFAHQAYIFYHIYIGKSTIFLKFFQKRFLSNVEKSGHFCIFCTKKMAFSPKNSLEKAQKT